MQNLYLFFKYLFFLLLCLRINIIKCEESNLNGMQYPKSFKLNNGKIIIVGSLGIYVYDSSGTELLLENSITEYQITSADDQCFTTFGQFESGEKYAIILVNHVIYILNSDGKKLFPFRLTHEINSEMGYYSIVPFIDENYNYNFILGILGENSQNKPILQYFSINFQEQKLITLDTYLFDSEDSTRENIKYDKGISCQIMEHMTYGNVLTCFYHNNRNPEEIGSFSFKLENNEISKIPMVNATYNDISFCMRSIVSQDKKRCLLCYIRNNGNYNERTGYCSIYNIDENRFVKLDKYLSKICETTNNYISLDYFKETREYIFACSGASNAEINFVKLDEDFNIIKIGENSDSNILVSSICQNTILYSITFSSNEYKVIGQFNCNGVTNINIFDISEDYQPSIIYSDLPEIESTDEKSLYQETSNSESYEHPEYTDYESSIANNLSSSDLNSESITNNCQWHIYNEETICFDNVPDGYYIFDKENKIIKECNKSCKTCKGSPENNNNNCLSCYENFELNNKNNCLYKYNYYYEQRIGEIVYLLANQLCPEKLPYEIIETKECVENCTNEDFINKKCKVNYFSEKNMDLITDKLRNLIHEITNSTCDIIIDGNNIIYEITTTKTNNDNYNISSIDFGECEQVLKSHYSLEYLLVFKRDIKLNDSYPTYVDYEVYSPLDKTQLNLSLCNKTQIEVNVPIHLDNYTNNLYNSMNKYGYDILDKNNYFYNDICIPFTSDDGTDMVLSDRQNNFYNGNITLCENNCIYTFYNSTNGKAKCQCQVKNEITDIKKISYEKFDVNTFFDIKTFSNIELIKCFKLTFSKNGLNKNYGFLIELFMISIFISLIILYNIYRKKAIARIIRLALKVNNFENPPRKSTNFYNSSKIISDSKYKEHKTQSNRHNSQTIRNLIESDAENGKRKKSCKNLTIQIGKLNLIQNDNKNYILNENTKKETNRDKYNRRMSKISKKTSRKSVSNGIGVYPIKQDNYNKISLKEADKNIHKEKYNGLELNNLEYKLAIKVDKRTYLQYYCSLIKIKHIILCIFLFYSDYNLITVKISLLIFNFCLYFTVNALFFTDKTMHKIYEGKGIFNLEIHLPQIFYSTLICTFINMLIKILALSGKHIIELKQIKNKEKAFKKSVELYRYLMIKFNIYYLSSLFLLSFCLYYISAFCAVYKNTQIILIENTLTSFLLTLIYPFALNLLPGIFRIPALKTSKKDKEGLYKVGNIISLVI